MFWKRPKYRLPRFPATVAKTFKFLCGHLDAEGIRALTLAVDSSLQAAIDKDHDSGMGDIENAKKIAAVCHHLLSRHGEFPPKLQHLIVGAVRYFAVEGDPFDDKIFASGLYDDMRIINHVLEKLGINDRYLSY